MSEAPQTNAVPARGASHYAKGTAANMARSMAVIVAITMALFFVVGRTSDSPSSNVDIPAAAQQHGQQAGQPFAYATDLPDGWGSTNARYVRSKGGIYMWNAGYTTPDGQYVTVQQVLDPPEDWIATQTNHGGRVGTVVTDDGTRWSKRDREGKVQRTLVDQPGDPTQLTTLVTGTGSWEQLEIVANHLESIEVATHSS